MTDKMQHPESSRIGITGIWACLPALVLAIIACYPILFNGFAEYYEERYFLANPSLESLRWFDLVGFLSLIQFGEYMPLTNFFFKIQQNFFGQQAMGYHVISLLLHLAVVVSVFQFTRKLSEHDLMAGLTAMLYAIHPMQIETVAWPIMQSYQWSALCYFGCLSAYLSLEGKSPWAHGKAVGLFGAALLSSWIAITLPIMLLLLDVIRQRRFSTAVWLEKIPYLGLALVFGVLALHLHIDQWSDAVKLNFSEGVFTRTHGFFLYFFHLIAPVNFSADYPLPVNRPDGFSTIIYLSPVFALIYIAITLYTLKKHKLIFFGLIFFLVNLFFLVPFPYLSPKFGVFIADHTVYLAYWGIMFFLAVVVVQLFSKRFEKFHALVLAFISMFIIALTLLSNQRGKAWKDGETLWSDVLISNPNSALAHLHLGTIYNRQGLTDEAIESLERSVAIDTGKAEAFTLLGDIYQRQNDFVKALTHYKKAIAADPADPGPLLKRSGLYRKAGQHEDALEDLAKVLSIRTDQVKALAERGLLYYQMGEKEKATADFNRALAIDSNDFDVFNNRGQTYRSQGFYDLALKDFDKALSINQQNFDTWNNRGNIHKEQGRSRMAIYDYTEALRLDPNSFEVLNNRGNAFINLNVLDSAVEDLNKAVKICDRCAIAYYNRGIALGKQGLNEQAIEDFNLNLALKGQDLNTLQNRGNVYLAMGAYEKALADYQSVLEINPKDARAYYNMGVVMSNQAQYKKAIEYYTKTIELRFGTPEAFNNRSIAYKELGDYEAAYKDAMMAKNMGLPVKEAYIEDIRKHLPDG